jgi:hypothetical protein
MYYGKRDEGLRYGDGEMQARGTDDGDHDWHGSMKKARETVMSEGKVKSQRHGDSEGTESVRCRDEGLTAAVTTGPQQQRDVTWAALPPRLHEAVHGVDERDVIAAAPAAQRVPCLRGLSISTVESPR